MLRYHRGSKCRKQLPPQGREMQDVGTVKLRSLEAEAGPAEATLTTLRRRPCLAGAGVSEGGQCSYFCDKVDSAAASERTCRCWGENLLLGRYSWKQEANRKEQVPSSSLIPAASLSCHLSAESNRNQLAKQNCSLQSPSSAQQRI